MDIERVWLITADMHLSYCIFMIRLRTKASVIYSFHSQYLNNTASSTYSKSDLIASENILRVVKSYSIITLRQSKF